MKRRTKKRLEDYAIILLVHAVVSIPFWLIIPRFNYIILLSFAIQSIYISTKEGRDFYYKNETKEL